ncbi:MAG: hypothetical protein BWY84_00160 [Candidatus Aerophobetes bacterium ADurb.Bin490]|nr:MAG: hypothetical protein BWY84_00160 [Candidatus Aerophobetes bacterium ADurb.Bin490]
MDERLENEFYEEDYYAIDPDDSTNWTEGESGGD